MHYTPLHTFPNRAGSAISSSAPIAAIPVIPVKEDATQVQQIQVPNNAQLYNQMMMMQAQHQAQMHYMQQCIMHQQSQQSQHTMYNQQYSGQYYSQGQYAGYNQQYAPPPQPSPSQGSQESSSETLAAPSSSSVPAPPAPAPTATAPPAPTPAPPSEDNIPQLSSSPTEDPRSSSPVIFSNIISETSSVVTPSATRLVRAPTTPSLSISSVPSVPSSFTIVGSEKDSPFIIKKMKEFKDFSPKEDHVRFWCKCDSCVFFAKNGVDIRLEGHMKYLIMDKKINFLSFFYRTRCKCGNNSKDCPVPPNKLSMFYSHKDDKDFNDPMVILDWGKRCQRAHCWNPSCDRIHFPFTFRGDRKF